MKLVSPDFNEHLLSGATRLSWCWRITRADVVIAVAHNNSTFTSSVN